MISTKSEILKKVKKMDSTLIMIKYELRNKRDELLSSSYCHRVFIPPGRFVAQKRVDGHYCEMINIRACRITFETDTGFTVWTMPESVFHAVYNMNNN